MRLYPCGLDMRACHPADKLDRDGYLWSFHAPPPRFQEKRKFSSTLLVNEQLLANLAYPTDLWNVNKGEQHWRVGPDVSFRGH